MRSVGLSRTCSAFSMWLGTLTLAALVFARADGWRPIPEAIAQPAAERTVCASPPPAKPPPGDAVPRALCPPPPEPAGPQVWGAVQLRGFATGLRPGPNGVHYDPLLSLGSDINYGLLPHKQLYLFLLNDFWIQRSATRDSGLSQREFDVEYGIAWNYWDSLELRVFGYALNNLNRGTSLTAPQGYKDGVGIENRYYFHYPDIYDVSRLGYVGIGYYPSQALVGNNGQSFKPGLFATGYLTESLPTPFTSYLFGGVRLTNESSAGLRLFGGNFGIAVRPVADRQNLEFRLGDAVRDDLKAGVTENYVYGAMRIAFEAGGASERGTEGPSSLRLRWPEAWGVLGLPFYIGSSRMAPNGVAFAPIFAATSDLNLGLLPDRKLYLFWDGDFWAQHSAGITASNHNSVAFSKREIDSNLGLAWNYFDSWELRGSVYALNNLNRGDSPSTPRGGQDGVMLENRYYFAGPDAYDVGRTSFVGFGYIPTDDLVGDNGKSFRPGPFARAYLARDLPIPWFRSYLYAGLQITAEHTALPRLFDTDVGWAVRPFSRWQSLEFRIGDEVSQDIVAASSRNLIYGAVRLNFGPRTFGQF
jgi:hypothetical protein